MEWVDELFQVVGLWGLFDSAVAVGVGLGVDHALKHTTFSVHKH